MSINAYTKDPDAKLDYLVNWANWLQEGETISSSAWGIDVAPDAVLTIAVSPAPSNTTTSATVWLQGGTVGKTYRVRNRIVSSLGRTDDQSFHVRIAQR
jgi:hypothetical protein